MDRENDNPKKMDPSGVYRLDKHGWNGCSLTLDGIAHRIPTWKDLILLRPPETYYSRNLHFPYTPIQTADQCYYPALQMGEQIDEGSYGRIIKANRAVYHESHGTYTRIEEFSEIVCKINGIEVEQEEDAAPEAEREGYYADEIQAVLNEAVLHALASEIMKKRGFPTVIPQLYEVFGMSHHRRPHASQINSVVIGMEYVQGRTLHKYLAEHFQPSTNPRDLARNDRLLMDILIQLCIYLEILQDDLRFNHRDLKTNNVLRRTQPQGWYRSFQHPSLSRPWIAYHDLVLIDFGFSCVACKEDTTSLIQAGCWFRPEHECVKCGRDIALFLHCLQVYFPLQKRISTRLWSILHAATQVQGIEQEPSLLDYGVKEDGTIDWTTAPTGYFTFSDGVYRLLRKKHVRVEGCTPAFLLASLDSLREKIEIAEG